VTLFHAQYGHETGLKQKKSCRQDGGGLKECIVVDYEAIIADKLEGLREKSLPCIADMSVTAVIFTCRLS